MNYEYSGSFSTLAFVPKAFLVVAAAGLLAYSLFGGLPIPIMIMDSDSIGCQKVKEHTAAGTASDSHGVPFSSRNVENERETIAAAKIGDNLLIQIIIYFFS